MERAQRRRPGIVTGRTMSGEAGTPVGLYHNVCGTLNGRSLADGSMLYGCTCNLSVDLARVDLDFDMTFTEVGRGMQSGLCSQTQSRDPCAVRLQWLLVCCFTSCGAVLSCFHESASMSLPHNIDNSSSARLQQLVG
jgi:hypothetical protein